MKLFFCLLLLASFEARAGLAPLQAGGDGVGNGGDALVCADGSVEMLDLYEARVLRGLEFDQSLTGATAEETAKNILARMAKFDPVSAKNYGKKVDAFRENAGFVPDANLVDVPDSNHIVIPRNCELRQVAIQRKPQFPEERFYLIDATIWNRMSVRDQASLMLHEIIYTDTLERGQVNSIRARYFNSYLSAAALLQLKEPEYAALRGRAGLQNFWTFSYPEKWLFVKVDDNLDGVDQPERAESVCGSLGLKVGEFKNDSLIRSKYWQFGNPIAVALGPEAIISASYRGMNGRGRMVILGAEFSTKRFNPRNDSLSSDYTICQK
ncbi:MAG: hypothetical protein AB7K68_00125 [Bacteriovoracia bacterium]